MNTTPSTLHLNLHLLRAEMEAKVAEQGRMIAGLERRALALTRVFTWSTGGAFKVI